MASDKRPLDAVTRSRSDPALVCPDLWATVDDRLKVLTMAVLAAGRCTPSVRSTVQQGWACTGTYRGCAVYLRPDMLILQTASGARIEYTPVGDQRWHIEVTGARGLVTGPDFGLLAEVTGILTTIAYNGDAYAWRTRQEVLRRTERD